MPILTTSEPQAAAVSAPRRGAPWQMAVLLLPLLLYAAGLNPFFAPGSYDEVLYYSGAVSLLEEGSFKFRGQYISDWPPGFPALLSVLFYFTGPSLWAAKICVLCCAGTGLLLAWRLFQKEQRAFPLLAVVLFALLPSSFILGISVLSEWPYFLASMLFLHALSLLRDPKKPFRTAVIAGLCLGIAALTKFTGVMLGAAIVAQAVEKWQHARRPRRWCVLAPEAITAVIGAGCYLAWKAKIHWQIAAGTAAPYEYYTFGLMPEHLGGFDPWILPEKISDLFFRSAAILEALGWHGWFARLAISLPALLVFVGFGARLASRKATPSDAYVLLLLVLFASFAENKQTRYLMPAAPFLVSYALLGGQRIGQWLREAGRKFAPWPATVAIAGWILLSIALAGQLLFGGNPAGTYRGLCLFVSRTPESFYKGSWLELYRACQLVRNDPAPGSIAVIGGEDKYVSYFTRRHWIEFKPDAEFAFLLVWNGADLPREEYARLNLKCLKRGKSVVLYKRQPDPLPGRRPSEVNASLP